MATPKTIVGSQLKWLRAQILSLLVFTGIAVNAETGDDGIFVYDPMAVVQRVNADWESGELKLEPKQR